MKLEVLYEKYQPFLFSVAYRMLGSVSDAEDIVHDLFLQLNPESIVVKDIKAYLAKAVTNRCLNRLNAAQKRREMYTGPWLPEPQVHQNNQGLVDKVVTDENVSYAFLVLLEQLSPLERAVFVLREAFDYDYRGIAEILGKTDVNCRKVCSRAKQKLKKDIPVYQKNTEEVNLLAKTFIKAATTGDFEEFMDALTDDVVLVTDGGGKVLSALKPIVSKQRVFAFLEGITGKNAFAGELLLTVVNDQSGIMQIKDGRLIRVISFEFEAQQRKITNIFIISNPDKLKHISVPK
ncbi:RNA polymerase sigma-70 factor [Gracilibacillus sp. HCP3S3_G5_1]|uniref:RNA polymerase sigma-70 factor n=1 Tax=unclassified Gracilibacillus TaxID=2625209 RepID=UPI003F896C18